MLGQSDITFFCKGLIFFCKGRIFTNVKIYIYKFMFSDLFVCFRTSEVGCESDMEFLAKVHCVRQASEVCFHLFVVCSFFCSKHKYMHINIHCVFGKFYIRSIITYIMSCIYKKNIHSKCTSTCILSSDVTCFVIILKGLL